MNTPTTRFELATDSVSAAADWLVVGIWEGEPATVADVRLDHALGGSLSHLIAAGDVTGKLFELVSILNPSGIAARRVLLIGLGKHDAANRQSLHEALAAAARSITTKQLGTVAIVLPTPDSLLAAGVGFAHGCSGPGIRKAKPSRFAPDRIVLIGDVKGDCSRVQAEAHGLWLARDLVNTPPSELYPETFATRAVDTGKVCGFEVEIWDEGKLAAERMGALLAVSRGSVRPARLAILRYNGNPGGPTLGLVGKGVTFDSGGLSLKTTEQMVDMKCDMAGAACVLGGVAAIAELKLKVNVLGVLALVENMPGGRAFKLGDVLTARNGKTIEVLNTDAEGRLILADALSYASESGASHLVDFATLTGACMIALGPHVAGLMTNDDAWGERVLSAISRAGERAWKLPMDASYDEMIRSKIADMRNTGGSRYGGAITAAKLLQQFVGSVPWVHMDIAGPSWAEGETPALDAGGTGTMVRSIVEMALAFDGQ